MITEDYVSFETAKLLREKGFDEKCQKVYMHNGKLLWAQIFMEGESFVDNKCIEEVANYDDWITYTQGEYAYLCPTLQMAMKWLREVYKFEVRSTYDYDKESWWGNINPMFEETDENSDIYQKALGFDYQGKSYEEACEIAIKYCLKNLI